MFAGSDNFRRGKFKAFPNLPYDMIEVGYGKITAHYTVSFLHPEEVKSNMSDILLGPKNRK
jgi:hypothetical protein